MPSAGFEVAGGSIPGRDHLGRNEILLGRNNQDAFRWRSSDEVLVAVVCDGCGSAPHSEVGANVGAELLINALGFRLRHCCSVGEPVITRSAFEALLEDARLDVLGRMNDLARQLAGDLSGLNKAVQEYLLFTAVGLLITEHCGVIFSIGDGIWGMNGELHRLGPFPDNAPPYLCFGLLPERALASQHDLHFRMHGPFPSGLIDSLLIGTDGVVDLAGAGERCVPGTEEPVGPISQFWEDDLYFRNSDAVRRRLSVINREVKRSGPDGGIIRTPGLLRDDTTLIVARRPGSNADQKEGD